MVKDIQNFIEKSYTSTSILLYTGAIGLLTYKQLLSGTLKLTTYLSTGSKIIEHALT